MLRCPNRVSRLGRLLLSLGARASAEAADEHGEEHHHDGSGGDADAEAGEVEG